MQGQSIQQSPEGEPVWLTGVNPAADQENPQPPVWARYVQSRLRHFRCSANPRGDPPPVVPMVATADD